MTNQNNQCEQHCWEGISFHRHEKCCNCGTAYLKPTKDSDWSKDFDEEFGIKVNYSPFLEWNWCSCNEICAGHDEEAAQFKSFISNTLTEQKKKIVEKLEGKKMLNTKEESTSDWFYGFGYNAALNDAIKAIEEI